MIKALFRFTTFVLLASVLSLTPGQVTPVADAEELFPYVKTFTISAYYSPCEGQERYATGSYSGDIRLNGSGVNSADGTPVYPGMVAAPKTYPFGTKMSIPGIGTIAIHDRGGAIVQAGERGQEYDRLDVWMGYCDAGLQRALTWGKKALDVTVYGIDDSIVEEVYLEGFSIAESFVKNVILAPQLFDKDVWYLSTGEDVEDLQRYLKELGYFDGKISGYYGDETRDAVYRFQLDNEIVHSPEDLGAGHTGVNTRKVLDLAIARMREEQEQAGMQKLQKGRVLLENYPDLDKSDHNFVRSLELGMIGDDVRVLQEELVNMGLLRIPATGYYGELTQHAVFKFQQKIGILASQDELGAGIFGPQTRERMNSLVNHRLDQVSYIAYNRNERNPLEIPTQVEDGFVRALAVGDRGGDVKDLQALLKQLGFFKGAFLTEFYGEQTKAALVAFQLANQLIESEEDPSAGVLNEATRSLLNSLS